MPSATYVTRRHHAPLADSAYLLLLLVAAALPPARATAASSPRVSVDVSFGWRFRMGLAGNGAACNASAYPPSGLNDRQVFGLTHAAQATDLPSCLAAACAEEAQIFQWCPGGGLVCGPASCWVGTYPGGSRPGPGWVSGLTNATALVDGAAPAEAAPDYDASAWAVVDLPHDFLVGGEYGPLNDQGQAYLPFNVSFYRKALRVPAAWAGSRIELYVGAAAMRSRWWLNGAPLGGGVAQLSSYTPHVLRLDDSPALVVGGVNIVTAFVDGTEKTGWWFEGSGLMRRVFLTSSAAVGGIATHGIAAPANVSVGAVTLHDATSPAAGAIAPAVVFPTAVLRNDGAAAAALSVVFAFVDAGGSVVASGSAAATVPARGNATSASTALALNAAELWSVPRPYLYTLTASVFAGAALVDAVNTTVGIRAPAWDASTGFFLNGQHVKMRGFCNHENFGSIGAAIPARVDLLRLQQLRGLGGNAWRTSHNAPETELLDLTDRLGVLVMDENRIFAEANVADMTDLVTRDRTHASVIWWSFCNEGGCGDGSASPSANFRAAAYAADGSRPVGANLVIGTPTAMSALLDVVGFSHFSAADIAAFHAASPTQPVVSSECCSCEGQRGEDADQPYNSSVVFYSAETSGCMAAQSQWSNGAAYNAGTFIWTLHDYLGEPDAWPHVSSSFGQFDVAGFPKAPSFWLRAWWLAAVPPSDAGRPPLPAAATATSVYLAEAWSPSRAGGGATRTLHAYTNAPYAQLLVNGAPFGAPIAVPAFGTAAATVAALAGAAGPVLATHTRTSWGSPAALRLTADAPSPSTGTGAALYLDGGDVALLRATVVDEAGAVCADAVTNVTFSVVAGPGVVLGTVNGDPSNHDPNAAPWKPAYHGLVRGLVRAALVAVGDLPLLAAVNVEAGLGGAATAAILPAGVAPPASITVAASAPGLPTALLMLPLSVRAEDAVLAVAAASVSVADPAPDGLMVLLSASPTASVTPSMTPSASATLSVGAPPSTTATATATAAPSPSSGAPAAALLLYVTPPAVLNAVEVIIVDVDGRNVARTAAVNATSTWGGQAASFLINGLADYTSSSDVYSGSGSTAGDAVLFTLAAPTVLSTVYFVNRFSNGFEQRVVAGAGAARVLGVDGATLGGGTLSAAAVTTLSFVASSAPLPPPPPGVQSAALARFIVLAPAVGSQLMFRELFVYTAAHVNVALRKAAGGTGPGGAAFPDSPAYGVDGVLDVDAGSAGGSLVSSGAPSVAAGDTTWTLDLGAAYNVSYLQLWNAWSASDAAVGAALANATLTALNAAGAVVGVATLSAALVQTLVLAAPSPSCSATRSATAAPTRSASRSASWLGTASVTPPPTATPASTPPPTATASPSWVDSASVTASATPPAAAAGLTLSTTAANVLNFIELFAFSAAGQDVAAAVLGATSVWAAGAQYQTQSNAYGHDLFADPWLAAASSPQRIAGTAAGPATWALTFAAPAPITTVVLVNRLDGGLFARMNASGSPGVLTLLAPNGSALATRPVSALSVSVWSFGAAAPAPPPDAAAQADPARRAAWVRFVNISAAPGACLSFRELYVLDAALTNVALLRPASMGAGGAVLASYVDAAAGIVSTAAAGVDGAIEMDAATGSMVHTPCDGTAWWGVDLGGVVNVSRLVFWNRFPLTSPTSAGAALGAAAAGATVTLANAAGAAVWAAALSGDMVQSIPVALAPVNTVVTATAAAAATASGTATLTAAPSRSAAASVPASATLTAASSISTTATSAATQTASSTAPPTPAPSVTASAAPTPSASAAAPTPPSSATSTRPPAATRSSSHTAAKSKTASSSASGSHSPSGSVSATSSPCPSPTATATGAASTTPPASPSSSTAPAASATAPPSASASLPPSSSVTAPPPTSAKPATASHLASRTPTASRTGSRTQSGTRSSTRSPTATRSGTRSASGSRRPTASATPTRKAKRR